MASVSVCPMAPVCARSSSAHSARAPFFAAVRYYAYCVFYFFFAFYGKENQAKRTTRAAG